MLNVAHIPGALRLAEFGLVRSKYEEKRLRKADLDVFKKKLEEGKGYWATIETPLFVYDYEQL